MTETEFQSWYNRASLLLDDVKRFVEARGGMAGDLLGEWHAILADTSAVDANRVLDMLVSGEIPRGEYFDVGRLPGIVMREAKTLASQRKVRRQYGSEQRFRCATCRDTGLVAAWNPQFVESYRDKFAEVSREEIDRDAQREEAKKHPHRLFVDLDKLDPDREIVCYRYQPANWLSEAARWWRGFREDAGPIHHLVRCNCGGERAQVLLRERERFEQRDRKVRGYDQGPPACGMADYNPRVMPLKTSDPYQDLLDWYGAHEANAVYEWTPDANDYARY